MKKIILSLILFNFSLLGVSQSGTATRSLQAAEISTLSIVKQNLDTLKMYQPRQSEIIIISGNASATTTLYTVTAGKIFYMTGYCIEVYATGTANASNYNISDNGGSIKISFIAPPQITGTPLPTVTGCLDLSNNPIPFTTNVRATMVNASGGIFYNIYGYER
jgi:hypothetical protein